MRLKFLSVVERPLELGLGPLEPSVLTGCGFDLDPARLSVVDRLDVVIGVWVSAGHRYHSLNGETQPPNTLLLTSEDQLFCPVTNNAITLLAATGSRPVPAALRAWLSVRGGRPSARQIGLTDYDVVNGWERVR